MLPKQTTDRCFAPNRDKAPFRLPRFFRLVRLRNFVWFPALAATYLFISTSGTPHILWSYETSNSGNGRIACHYFGQFSQRTGATNGRCPIIRFIH